MRGRLDLEQPQGGNKCLHILAGGPPCGAALDGRGVRAMSCQAGGWSKRRHDSIRDVVAAFAVEHGGIAATECVLPYAAPGLNEARMDAIVRATGATGQQLIDVSIATPLSQEMLRHGAAGRTPGAAAAAAAQHKRSKYPNVDVTPFIVEHYVQWGDDALAIVKLSAPPPDRGRSEALNLLDQDVTCAVQRGNADAIVAAASRPK